MTCVITGNISSAKYTKIVQCCDGVSVTGSLMVTMSRPI